MALMPRVRWRSKPEWSQDEDGEKESPSQPLAEAIESRGAQIELAQDFDALVVLRCYGAVGRLQG